MDEEKDQDDTQTTDADQESDQSGDQESRESSTREGNDSHSSDTGSDSDSEVVTDLKAKLAQANKEAAKYRKERNTAQSELKKHQDAELSDLEREKKRADEAEQKLTASLVKVQNANLAVALSQHESGIVDAETASLLLRERGIEFDDDGTPIDFDTKVTDLVKDKPFLVGQGGTPRRAGNTNAGAGSNDGEGSAQLTSDELAMAAAFKMTPEEYSKYKDVRPS